MTSTTKDSPSKLIHIAQIYAQNGESTYLFLRKIGPQFVWFQESSPSIESETNIEAATIEEAMRLGYRFWKNESFRTVICGFRYTLPERDEHGINALYHQMAASYSSMNGVYYDEELGNNCFVQGASNEALQLWQRLKTK